MGRIFIFLFSLSIVTLIWPQCNENVQHNNLNKITKTILKDILHEGVSKFRYQKDMFGKRDWKIYLNENCISLDSLQRFIPPLPDSVLFRFQQGTEQTTDFPLDVNLTIPDTEILHVSLDTLPNIEHHLFPLMAQNNITATILFSKLHIVSHENGSQVHSLIAVILWPGNVVPVFYTLKLTSEEPVILSRQVL